jgi:hypothetical protein
MITGGDTVKETGADVYIKQWSPGPEERVDFLVAERPQIVPFSPVAQQPKLHWQRYQQQ